MVSEQFTVIVYNCVVFTCNWKDNMNKEGDGSDKCMYDYYIYI